MKLYGNLNNRLDENVDDDDSRSWCERELKRLKYLKKHRTLTVEEEETYYYCKSTIDSIDSECRFLNGESEL